MAIFKHLPGVEVTVTVKSKPLKEYSDPDHEEGDFEVTRYIEAQTDKTFKVKVFTKKAATRGAGLMYAFSVDGALSETFVFTSEDLMDQDFSGHSKGFEIGHGKIRQYKFAELQTVSAPTNHKLTPKDLHDLGSIKVRVYHLSKCTDGSSSQEKSKPLRPLETIPETAIKGRALSHSIGFGKTVGDTAIPTDAEYFSDEPIVTFRFLYRSKEALKQEGIIPRSPPPPPLEDRDVTTWTQEDMRDMQRQFKAMKEAEAERVKIKREHKDEQERPVPRKKARPSEESEVIDLD